MIWLLSLLPLLGGCVLWAWPISARDERERRRMVGAGAAGTVMATLGLAIWAAAAEKTATVTWTALLRPALEAVDEAAIMAILVPVVALPVVIYAASHEPTDGLVRQVGLIVAFVGAMELLVLANDLFTLLVGWELVSALSWGLIAHDWRTHDKAKAAAHAFNVTKLGSLGLLVAAGAAVAASGSLSFDRLATIEGGWLHVLVAGVLLAATTKSAQLPFSPWLFSAMSGPTPVSALLHSATMVAAGAYLLIRLHDVLRLAPWFDPVVVAFGIVTALAGGIVAILQGHIKKLLAASTSAQYGLMFVAVGAGYPAAALVHLVAHALFKSQLFLASGVAISTAGTEELRLMRVGGRLPRIAVLTGIGVLALAALPPLGAAWTKEQIVAAAGHYRGWLAVVVAAAGGLGALYAARFQLLAFGRSRDEEEEPMDRATWPLVAIGFLAALTLLLSLAWLPSVEASIADMTSGPLPEGKAWETVLALALVAAGIYVAWGYHRSDHLERLGVARRKVLADWYGLPAVARGLLVMPFLALARRAADFDDRVVDGGVRAAAAVGRMASGLLSRAGEPAFDGAAESFGAAARSVAHSFSSAWETIVDRIAEGVAGAIGFVARDASRTQTGLLHHYYLYVVGGVVILVVTAALWR